jgi:hypothetical protein
MASSLVASEKLNVSADIAFSRICSIQTWPVWLSFVKRAELDGYPGVLTTSSDILLASDLSDGKEEVFEVEELIEPYLLTLVGAFSCRRRIQFRVESQDDVSKVIVKIAYVTHGGLLQKYADYLTSRRKLHSALVQSLQTFKALVEHDATERHERASALLMTS